MKKVIALAVYGLLLVGCDIHRGPVLFNATDTVLGVDVVRDDGQILQTELLPSGTFSLGGPVGGPKAEFEKVSIYDSENQLIKEILFSRLSEQGALVIESSDLKKKIKDSNQAEVATP